MENEKQVFEKEFVENMNRENKEVNVRSEKNVETMEQINSNMD